MLKKVDGIAKGLINGLKLIMIPSQVAGIMGGGTDVRVTGIVAYSNLCKL